MTLISSSFVFIFAVFLLSALVLNLELAWFCIWLERRFRKFGYHLFFHSTEYLDGHGVCIGHKCYNLTATLTIEWPQPFITDINQPKCNGDCLVPKWIVCIWVYNYYGVPVIKARIWDTLSRKTDNNGVAATVDEIPYINVFVNHHCRNYIMAQ